MKRSEFVNLLAKVVDDIFDLNNGKAIAEETVKKMELLADDGYDWNKE